MANLQRALEIAVESHKNQKQKDGSPYALHPIRLSLTLKSEEQKIVALLHDVVEDTDWTLEDLMAEGFSGSIIEALGLLTHTDYPEGEVPLFAHAPCFSAAHAGGLVGGPNHGSAHTATIFLSFVSQGRRQV